MTGITKNVFKISKKLVNIFSLSNLSNHSIQFSIDSEEVFSGVSGSSFSNLISVLKQSEFTLSFS